jgi:hypothetical protein
VTGAYDVSSRNNGQRTTDNGPIPAAPFLPSHAIGIISLVVQAFLKAPALKALAPTQAEPPFALGTFSVIGFRLEPLAASRLAASLGSSQ